MTETGADAWTAFDRANDGFLTVVLGLAAGSMSGLLAAVSAGPGSASELAERAGTDERMTLEWLRLMTVAGFIDHAAGTFTAREGLDQMVEVPGLGRFAEVVTGRVARSGDWAAALAEAIRTGHGIPHSFFEPESSLAQDLGSRFAVAPVLVDAFIRPVPGLEDALRAGCDVLDIGCGTGWALERLAREFPAGRYVGYDFDEVALSLGRSRLDGRPVRLENTDALALPPESADVVLALDMVHDIGDPVGFLRAVRRLLRPGGVLLMTEDDATGDFEVDRHTKAVAGFAMSLGLCLPQAQADGGVGLGPFYGRAAALALLTEAGYVDISVHHTDVGANLFVARTPRSA